MLVLALSMGGLPTNKKKLGDVRGRSRKSLFSDTQQQILQQRKLWFPKFQYAPKFPQNKAFLVLNLNILERKFSKKLKFRGYN